MVYWLKLAVLSGCAVVMVMPAWIGFLRHSAFFQPIRSDGPQLHQVKVKTPSMGGVVMCLIWAMVSFYGSYAPSALLRGLVYVACAYAAVGLYDDVLKVCRKDAYALGPRQKFVLQIMVAVGTLLWLAYMGWLPSLMVQKIPFAGEWTMPYYLGIPLAIWVLVGSANAINLVDGLDGLASGVVISIALGLWVCNTGSASHELNGPLLVLVAVLMAFLSFNHKPALIMMGDSGSLFLGAVLAYVALASKLVFFYALMSFVPVMTTCSVILQVLYYKKTGRRFFKMAPIHHHFELLGVPETHVVIRAWLISGLSVVGAYLCLNSGL